MRNLIRIVENSMGQRFYHVTEREHAADIIANGFLGGWGDAGFGVYLYDNLYDAREYAAVGGWDNGLEDPVILEVIEVKGVERVPVLSAEWDAEKYANMWWYPIDDDDEDQRWIPHSVRIIE